MEDIDNRICQSAYKEKNMMGGRVRIAVLTSLVATILSKALKEYRSLYPEIEIEIKEGTPNDIFKMVEEYSADFAVSCSPFGKFHAVPLIHDRIMAMFPPKYKGKSTVTVSYTHLPVAENQQHLHKSNPLFLPDLTAFRVWSLPHYSPPIWFCQP